MSTSSTVPPLATAYELLRPRILQRLLELRGTLDPALGRMDEATARGQVGAVLDHLGNFIVSGDMGQHRAFLHTFLAMRAAEAQSPAAVLAMLVAIGDTAAQVAQDEGAGTAEGAELTLLLTKVTVDFELSLEPVGIRVRAEVKVGGQTGVEMEALTAVSIACLTLYDMLKAADKGMSFEGIHLVEKTGGRSGTYQAAPRDASTTPRAKR